LVEKLELGTGGRPEKKKSSGPNQVTVRENEQTRRKTEKKGGRDISYM